MFLTTRGWPRRLCAREERTAPENGALRSEPAESQEVLLSDRWQTQVGHEENSALAQRLGIFPVFVFAMSL